MSVSAQGEPVKKRRCVSPGPRWPANGMIDTAFAPFVPLESVKVGARA